jgi:hypothetical protein
VFKEHLFLGGVETSTDEPQIIAWSDAGDFEDFTAGTAGAQILYELIGGIKAMETLGDRLIIYSDDAIASGVFVGVPAVFAFETVIPEGTRLISPKSIVSINVGHVYASEENFYLFDGTRGLRPLADIIRTDYSSAKDAENLHRVAVVNDYSKKTLYFALPEVGGGNLIYTMEYDAFNLAQRTWAREAYVNNPRAFGFFTNSEDSPTWADTAVETALYENGMTWKEEGIAIWGNESEQKAFPVRVFGDDAGYVHTVSDSQISDNGTTKRGYYSTIDFTIPQIFQSLHGRWGEIEFEAGGITVDVSIAKDLDTGFNLVEKVSLSNTPSYNRLPIDITARAVRVRFDFLGDFTLRWVRLWVKPTAAR